MKGQKLLWTYYVLLICWILPLLQAARRKRSMASYTKKVLEVLSVDYSNRNQFEESLDPFLVERIPGTPGNVAVQEFIEARMSALGWNITKDRFMDITPLGQKPFTNIIATFDPRAPNRLVLACHFDSKLMHGKTFVAATDSAVPCAMLIDLATNLNCLLRKSSATVIPQTTVQLVFLDGEEAFVSWSDRDSTYGARHLAQLWHTTPDPHDNSKTMLQTITDFVLLDLIGTSDVSFKNMFSETSQLYEKLYSIEQKLQNNGFLSVAANSYYRPFFANLPPQQMGIQDDHIPFLNKGVNILHLISVPFPSVWHKESDNKAALDFTSIDNFNRIFRVFVATYLRLDATKNACRRNLPLFMGFQK
ncbi:glutaminyl-peptide cyclotransferase isoform X2 [Patella vulgata]|uniref:glutaminyl-peptide cyclotransferase isoform X2 n=1 Tax=Patella vulgata TaxID=6465 RepID=UPI002180683E|nr:glutaminyl-peptide cyclotransferase isoform X2 [Patella vulgata]XP_050405028.1 glutaminyl-peptide cyclotransferase isoform X2 [Patella vulgata]